MILRGTRVIEFSHVLAGPHCGRQLADMGAEVIKVESPGKGDAVRKLGSNSDENGMVFVNQNAGKRSLSVDLQHAAGREAVLDLVAESDVVLENFRPGVMRRFGLDYASLKERNPALVMCSISAFGQSGPLADQGGFAYSAMAMSGALDLDRERDGIEHIGHLPVPDFLSALNAVAAIGFALLHRERTGEGQQIDISLIDCMLAAEDIATPCVINGQAFRPQRRPGVSVHRVPDGSVVMTLPGEDLFFRFADAIGAPELKADPRFATRALRIANQAAIDALIDQWIAPFSSRAAVVQFLASHKIPCAAVLSVQEAVDHPQVLARGAVTQVAGPQSHRVVRSAMRFSATPSSPQGPAPARVGSHTREVLADVLGYSHDRIDALIVAKAVYQA